MRCIGGAGAGSNFERTEARQFGIKLAVKLQLSTLNDYQPTMLVPHASVLANGSAGPFDMIAGGNAAPAVTPEVSIELRHAVRRRLAAQ